MKKISFVLSLVVLSMIIIRISLAISNIPSEHNSLSYEVDNKTIYTNGDICVYIRDQEVDINKKNSWMSINNESSVEITTYKKVYDGYKSTLKIYFNEQLLYEYDGNFHISYSAPGRIFNLSISNEDMVVLFTRNPIVKITGGDR